MARCSNCGKQNREGALFCQDCGQKIDGEAAKKPTPTPAREPQPCSSCGTVNPPGMNFCKMCGTPLGTRPPTGANAIAREPSGVIAASKPSAGPATGSTKIACSSCGKQTPSGFAFCQHCGSKIAPRSGTIEAAGPPAATPTPPAGMRPNVAFAPTIAPTTAPQLAAAGSSPARREPSSPSVAVGAKARLVILNADGSDGKAQALVGDTFDVGRTEGQLLFAEDPYLAARHARFLLSGGPVRVRPLDGVNGVYIRLREPSELVSGDQFLLGKEVLRFEPVAPEEREAPSLVEHGVRIFGSHHREAWGRLRQMTRAGTTRDLWHLTRPEFVLGREEGDVTFPDDEFMSGRHCALRRTGAKTRLEDMGSSNGTFLRLRGERELVDGDVLRLGDQLLRIEL